MNKETKKKEKKKIKNKKTNEIPFISLYREGGRNYLMKTPFLKYGKKVNDIIMLNVCLFPLRTKK